MGNDLQIPDGYALFTVRFERDTILGQSQSFHLGALQGTTPSGTSMLEAFIDAWEASGSLNEAQPTPVTATNLNVRYRISGDLFSEDFPNPWGAGGGSPALCSPAVTYCIKTHTALAGRQFRGRFQLPWAVESEVDEAGVVDGTVVGNYTVAAEVFRTALFSDATKLRAARVLHTKTTTAPTQITAMSMRNTVGTVRKRQRVGS